MNSKDLLEIIIEISNGNIQILNNKYNSLGLENDDFNKNLLLKFILYYLPETIDPEYYLHSVGHLFGINNTNSNTIDELNEKNRINFFEDEFKNDELKLISSNINLTNLDEIIKNLIKSIDLIFLTEKIESVFTFSSWCIQRARLIINNTGLISNALSIFNHPLFISNGDDNAMRWKDGILNVFNIIYPFIPVNNYNSFSDFESLDSEEGLGLLLSFYNSNEEKASKMSSIVSPYLHYKQDWNILWEWMISQSNSGNFQLIGLIAKYWEGPGLKLFNQHSKYARTLMACSYSSSETFSPLIIELVKTIEKRVKSISSELLSLNSDEFQNGNENENENENENKNKNKIKTKYKNKNTETDIDTDFEKDNSLTFSHEISAKNLTIDSCIITSPTNTSSINLFSKLIMSASIISDITNSFHSLKDILSLYFFSSADEQLKELENYILYAEEANSNSYNTDTKWKKTRESLRWLIKKALLFKKVDINVFESLMLKAMITAGRLNLVKEVYFAPRLILNREPILPLDSICKIALEAAEQLYNTSTSGDASKGNMKLASQTIDLIASLNQDESEELIKMKSLIDATNSLACRYNLIWSKPTFSSAAADPILPVQIRMEPDPIGLLEKIVETNPDAYRDADILIEIGCKLLICVSDSNPDINNKSSSITRDPPSTTTDLEEKILNSLKNFNDSSLKKDYLYSTSYIVIQARILNYCIQGAIAADNFDIAVLYNVEKLIPLADSISTNESSYSKEEKEVVLSLCWQSLFITGKYISSSMVELIDFVNSNQELTASSKFINSYGAVKYIYDQKVFLLSCCIKRCPSTQLPIILTTWSQVEKERQDLKSKFEPQPYSSIITGQPGINNASYSYNNIVPIATQRENDNVLSNANFSFSQILPFKFS